MSGPHILWPPTDTEGDAGYNRKRRRLSGPLPIPPHALKSQGEDGSTHVPYQAQPCTSQPAHAQPEQPVLEPCWPAWPPMGYVLPPAAPPAWSWGLWGMPAPHGLFSLAPMLAPYPGHVLHATACPLPAHAPSLLPNWATPPSHAQLAAAAGTRSSWPPSSSSSGSARCKAYGCSSQQATVIGVPVAYWQPLGLLPAYQHLADPTHPAHPPTPLAASPATSTSGSCSPPPPCPTAPRSPSPTSPPRPALPLALQPDAATSAATSTSARKPGVQQASSSTICLPAPPPAPAWQSAADLPHRLGIARGITHILQARCPQLPPPSRLALTRAMEVALYRAAPSPAAYLDASSLPARVLGVLRQRLAAAARRRAGLRCKASSGP